ncbi:WecB/TagA/CpsF family glycosyltransferase [Mariniblastus sp.]|nr:WecB/TagA/CpsF family glycosyltransferase [Mariniblastus sp.]
MANDTTMRLVTDSQGGIPIESDDGANDGANQGVESDTIANAEFRHSKTHQLGHSFPSVNLRGMKIHSVSLQQTVDHLIHCSIQNEGGWIVTPNLDILRRHAKSASFRNLVATSTLNVADGMPLVWISRVLGQPVPGRVNGTDLMVHVCEASANVGRSVFFLGGNRGAAEKTIQAMTDAFPDLNVAGCHCPEFGFENDVENIANIANILSEAKPDIIFVGLGSPKQDVLINMLRLTFPNVWWLGVGVSFSFIAGELTRAPDWAQKSGLEWLYRMIAEPKRLAKRYLVQGIPFFVATLFIAGYQRLFGSNS